MQFEETQRPRRGRWSDEEQERQEEGEEERHSEQEAGEIDREGSQRRDRRRCVASKNESKLTITSHTLRSGRIEELSGRADRQASISIEDRSIGRARAALVEVL